MTTIFNINLSASAPVFSVTMGDSVAFTVSSVGPKGEQGLTGAVGPVGPAGESANDVLFYFKSVDQSVASTQTLVDDNDLILLLDANRRYIVELGIVYAGASPRFALSASEGVTVYGTWNRRSTAGTSVNTDTALTSEAVMFAPGAGQVVSIDNTFSVQTSAIGTLRLRFAQNALSETETTVKTGSFIRAMDMGAVPPPLTFS